ncbi:hypothetical protein D3C74_118460 [compost metagenome]
MKWYTTYKDELETVFAEARERINLFPPSLRNQALQYMDRFDPLQEDSTRNYICYLLPYWLRDLTGLSHDAYRRLALGNVFVMLYFLLQDDVIDSPGEDCRTQLVLANLFLTESLDTYRHDFPTDSAFWEYYRIYVHEWADSVAGELTKDDFQQDRRKVALKASPLKLASTGALILAGKEAFIPAITDMTDDALVVLQMSDDWADWSEDLEAGDYNCLLSLISAENGHSYMEGLEAQQVEQAVFLHDALKRYAYIAVDIAEQLRQAEPVIPDLYQFAEEIARELLQEAEALELGKQRLQRGGLEYWLSRHLE